MKKYLGCKGGRTTLKYYCVICKKLISWQTWFNGKKHCQSCWQKGKKNGRFGKHWTKEQNKQRSKAPHEHHIDCNHKNNNKMNKIFMTCSGHLRAHGSLNKLVAELLKRKIIKFDKKEGIYKLR